VEYNTLNTNLQGIETIASTEPLKMTDNTSISALSSPLLSIGIPLFMASLAIVAVLTVTLNALFLFAILKKKLVNSPSNFLLSVLCVTDLLTGLVSLPLYTIGVSKRNTWLTFQGDVLIWASFCSWALQGCSFQLVVLASLDRYVAVCHPFKYADYATIKLYSILLACIASFFIMINVVSRLLFKEHTSVISYALTNVYTIASSIMLIFCSWRIYKVIQQKIKDMQALTVQDMNEIRKRQHEGQRAYAILLLASMHFICYLPFYICFHIRQNRPSMFENVVEMTFVKRWCYFAVFLNSVFNPLIYYFRISHFRAAIRKVIRCL